MISQVYPMIPPNHCLDGFTGPLLAVTTLVVVIILLLVRENTR